MIRWNPTMCPALIQCDETAIEFGSRQYIDAYTWIDDSGLRHVVLQPTEKELTALPPSTQRQAFSLAWVLSRMSDALDQHEANIRALKGGL